MYKQKRVVRKGTWLLWDTGPITNQSTWSQHKKMLIPRKIVPLSCMHLGQKCLSKGEGLMQTALKAMLHLQEPELLLPLNPRPRTDHRPGSPVPRAVAISAQRRKRMVQESFILISWDKANTVLVPSSWLACTLKHKVIDLLWNCSILSNYLFMDVHTIHIHN